MNEIRTRAGLQSLTSTQLGKIESLYTGGEDISSDLLCLLRSANKVKLDDQDSILTGEIAELIDCRDAIDNEEFSTEHINKCCNMDFLCKSIIKDLRSKVHPFCPSIFMANGTKFKHFSETRCSQLRYVNDSPPIVGDSSSNPGSADESMDGLVSHLTPATFRKVALTVLTTETETENPLSGVLLQLPKEESPKEENQNEGVAMV